MGLGAGDARRHDLAVFLDEVLQHVYVLVVDLLDAFGSEPAELLALEQVIAAFAAFAVLAFSFAFGKFRASSHRARHVSFLPSVRIRSHAVRRWCRSGSDGPGSRGSGAARRRRPRTGPWQADPARWRPARTRRAAHR